MGVSSGWLWKAHSRNPRPLNIFNTEWRNDSAAACVSPGAVQRVVGLSPALGARFFGLIKGVALRRCVCGATECQAAVVPPSPVVDALRGVFRGVNSTPPRGCVRHRTKQPTGLFFQIQPFIFLAMIGVWLSAAHAFALIGGRMGFFMWGGHDAKNFASSAT
jgi:hypothetical protein